MKSLIYALILIFSAALFYSLKQNFTLSAEVPEKTISVQSEVASFQKAESNKVEKESRQMFDLLEQADQVFSESWNVILQTRTTPQSVFKTIKNAIGKNLKKTSDGGVKHCIDTEVKRAALAGGDFTYQVFKTDCRQKSRNILAQYRISVSSEVEIMFYPQNMPESVGLALTVLNPKMYCRMSFDGVMLMKKMNCTNVGQNFASNKHLLMTNLLYQNNQKEVLKLSAVTFENLQNEISKFHLIVPLSGKIKLAEKKYEPKIIYVDAPKLVEIAKESKEALDSKGTQEVKPLADPFNIIADNEKAPEVVSKVKVKKEVGDGPDAVVESKGLPGVTGMDPNLNPNSNSPENQDSNIDQADSDTSAAFESDDSKVLDKNGRPEEEALVTTPQVEHVGQTKVIQKNLNQRETYIKQSAENIDVR